MSSSTQHQHSDSADHGLDGPSQNRYASRQDAFWSGIKHAAGAPAIVLFAGMVGFGAMAKTNGFDLWFPALTSLLMFALPGQVVLMEMVMTGSSVIAIALAVTLTSTRFITMTVTLFPQLHEKDRNRNLYASVHMLAMTVWSMTMREFPSIERKHRLNYFLGFGLVCWLMSIPGTILGYYLAAWVPAAITLGLIFINPLFFLLTFTDVKPWVNRIAIALGCILGPIFYFVDRDSSLLAAGLIAGTLAYYIDRKMIRKRPGVIG
ncbi:AzlC family ABC transporter permease [Polynucleobacter paludilacus]|uniref:AzlC family ABC transporter permease n=1 Tax=Polynucleobacter paludilacus TaxID=1855895 RepID=UPI001BFD270F|nr:AzlC family ABC transporter permease [Polynucleobacter paludilacus]QWD87422.1 AzlC family ABC transporter permease [Polynucleobacter paludilacus]